MAKKELWLKNNKQADVHLSDLGVKVGSLKTVNVYAYNPYLTEDKVKLSREKGSLLKRLNTGTLSVVKKPVTTRPHTLDDIKASTQPVEVVKTKTAVVVDTREMDVLDDDDLGEIADYGLGELGHENTQYVKDVPGSVVVKQKQDTDEELEPAAEVTMEKVPSKNASGQSIVAMANMAEKATNPVGDVAENTAPDQSFVVVKPPENAKKATPVEKPAVEGVTKVGKDESGAVVITGVDDGKKDASTSKYDAHVATKDESGAIVMKLKEVEGETAEKSTDGKVEAKPAKVAKKKTTKK